MLVMAQVVRDSSISVIASARIIAAHASTIKTLLSSSSDGSTELEEDASGLTFQEWTPDVDTSRPPVTMLINSSELCAAGFKLKEVLPPTLETAARVRTRGAGLRSLEGMGPKRFVLSVDDDSEFRSRCE
jgi:hypothetical protein